MSVRRLPSSFNIRKTALAVSLFSSLVSTQSWAEPVGYSIPPGSLATAINQFAIASGVTRKQ